VCRLTITKVSEEQLLNIKKKDGGSIPIKLQVIQTGLTIIFSSNERLLGKVRVRFYFLLFTFGVVTKRYYNGYWS
jgi:hypothetical protein